MKVAIAGLGNVSHYLIEELGAGGHEVVVLTRSAKPGQKGFEQRQTNYSIDSLVGILEDRDTLISTVADYENPLAATKAHLDMLEACRQSTRCKTFIPSEWTLNVEDYPEQPMHFTEANKTLHQRLKRETSIRWTVICNAWFADYVVPKRQRHLSEIGPAWPMDHLNKIFTIYGPGTQLVDFTSVRDVAKAVSALLNSEEPWEPYTYLSGDQLSWNELFTTVKRWDPQWTSQNKPLADSIRQIADKESPESVGIGYFEIQSYAGALTFSKEKVQSHRSKYFQGIHFRTVEEILAAAKEPEKIV